MTVHAWQTMRPVQGPERPSSIFGPVVVVVALLVLAVAFFLSGGH